MADLPTKLPKTPEDFLHNIQDYQCLLNDTAEWQSVPLLNYVLMHDLETVSLVRFRGMIQDMLDPEYYLEKYHVSYGSNVRMVEGKYRDFITLQEGETIDYDSRANVHGERRAFWVITTPGMNSWASSYEANYDEKCRQKLGNLVIGSQEKSATKQSTIESQTNIKEEYLLNSPIPERPSTACMIKVYSDFENYSLNSLVDVIGFFSMDPVSNDDIISEVEKSAPLLKTPVIHAIAINRLKHMNPLLDNRLKNSLAESPLNWSAVQKDLRILLKLCLFGDCLAAEYLLSHLISTVYNRFDLETIGKFALNLCNIPENEKYTQKLYAILELLLPASHYLPMTLEKMNSIQFIPKKDYETDKLVSGILQLAPYTHLVLDETRMHQGKLEANGIYGIQSISHLIRTQKLKCNFQFYDIDYDADVPVLVLSEGKSMLPSDFLLPLEYDSDEVEQIDEALKAANHFLQPAKLACFRRYLTEAKIKEFSMNPDKVEMIQCDFVEMRKQKTIKGADELHSLLVLSRYLAIARGLDVLDEKSWELAKDMESQRKNRVLKMPKKKV